MRITLVTIAAAMIAAAPVAAGTVMNGSFEQGSVAPQVGKNNGNSFGSMVGATGTSSWDTWDALVGWRAQSGWGIEVQTNGTLPQIDAHSGNYYVELDSNNNSVMSQKVSLGRGSYELSFYYSPRTSTLGDNGINYWIAGLEGTVSGPSAGPPPTAVGDWTQITARFTIAEADAFMLTFGATGEPNSLGGLIDTISISAVPLPASALLLLAGLGGLGIARRRRKA